MSEKRVRRIAEEIKKVISSILLKDLKDPRIDPLASITHVELSNDYSVAKIYVSTFSKEKREETIEGLNSAKGFLKREISKNIKLRIMPELVFQSDDSIEKSFELFEIIDRANKGKE